MNAATRIGILVVGGLAIAALAATAAASVSSSREGAEVRKPIENARSEDDLRVRVTPEMREHSRIRNILYFAGTAYGFGVLFLLLRTQLSRKMRDLTRRFGRPAVSAMAYFAIFTIVTSILTLPLDVYGGFVVSHRFELSNQTFVQWMLERLKGVAVAIAFGAPIMAAALWAIRVMPRRWWFALWLGGIPVSIFVIVLAPVIVDPVFNDFRRLKNVGLESRLLVMAERVGIEGADVFEVDKSRQTKTMNAYVSGLGPTKRIVIWDTLLEKMTDDEVVFVMAHEMGHYVLHHVWKGLAAGVALMFFVTLAGHRIVEWGVVRFGPSWGIESTNDPAAIPWLFLVLGGFLFILSPVISSYSRSIEHEADMFALELTHLNEAGARAFVEFAEDSKVDPSPNAFIEFWRYSHPPLAKRIEFALSYRPWTENKPNEVWHGSFVPGS